MHPDQAQNALSGIQGQETTAVAVIYVTVTVIHRRFSPNSYILKVFDYKILLGSLEVVSYLGVSSSEYL